MDLRHDFRHAARSLRKSPGYSLIAFATLAIALGANTAIFTVVEATLLRGLPYREPESLVLLWGNVERQRVERRGASFPDFLDWRREASSFAGMAATWDSEETLYGVGEPRQVPTETVSAAYFPLLGVEPILGRALDEADDVPGAAASAVLSEGLWRESYGGDPAVVGRSIRVGETTATVVGVLPQGFVGVTGRAALWLSVGAAVAGPPAEDRGGRWFPVLARLAPGVSLDAAQAEITTIARRLEAAYPETNARRGVEVAPLAGELLGDVRPHLQLAWGAVGVVLLLAAANVAGLALARADRRRRELAIRSALGAGHGALVRLLLVEGLLLAAAGAAAGGLLASWLTEALVAASPIPLPAFAVVAPNRGVFLFTLAVATGLGLFLGLAPATRVRARGTAALQAGAERAIGGTAAARLRQGLVIAEVALAMALLAAAGLLLRSLAAISAVDPGLRPEGVLTFRVQMPPRPATPEGGETAPATALQVLARLESLPGVERAALGSDLPYGSSGALFYTVEGQEDDAAETMPRAYWHRTTADFPASLGLALRRGRPFEPSEVESRGEVVIVAQAIAERFWPGEDPIGKRLKLGNVQSEAPWLEIVGVVADARYRALPRNPTPDPDLFLPFGPDRDRFSVVLSGSVDPRSLVPAARAAVREVVPEASVYDVAALSERIDTQLARPRFASTVTALFGAVALLLAALGVYGVIAEAVGARVPEIGLRMALGAAPGTVVAMVLRQGLVLASLGLAVGAFGTFAATRGVASLLYGVTPGDPLTLVAVALLLLAAALAATWLPARRAAAVDPVRALRRD